MKRNCGVKELEPNIIHVQKPLIEYLIVSRKLTAPSYRPHYHIPHVHAHTMNPVLLASCTKQNQFVVRSPDVLRMWVLRLIVKIVFVVEVLSAQ